MTKSLVSSLVFSLKIWHLRKRLSSLEKRLLEAEKSVDMVRKVALADARAARTKKKD